MKKTPRYLLMLLAALLAGCQPALPSPTPATSPSPTATVAAVIPTATAAPTQSEVTSTPLPLVPDFAHIVMIVFEHKEFDSVIGNRDVPYFNLFAESYTLLTQHHAIARPNLPNYLALIGGDTFNISDDCEAGDCFINQPSLPDLIEASGRTWKTYQDDMPEPCFTGETLRYARSHNPFIFFDSIRLNETRCKHRVVPLTQLDNDLILNDLPNFMFIAPDVCYSSRDCTLDLTDSWLRDLTAKLYPALDATGEPYLIIVTWGSGQSDLTCCGLAVPGGGRVATVLISPQVKTNFRDNTPYSHYSLLKTISAAWGLPYLGHAADEETALMTAPWR